MSACPLSTHHHHHHPARQAKDRYLFPRSRMLLASDASSAWRRAPPFSICHARRPFSYAHRESPLASVQHLLPLRLGRRARDRNQERDARGEHGRRKTTRRCATPAARLTGPRLGRQEQPFIRHARHPDKPRAQRISQLPHATHSSHGDHGPSHQAGPPSPAQLSSIHHPWSIECAPASAPAAPH